ncbi:TPA: CxxxxCH/CxxCH domain-containing protein [Acinetobacter baumannii]
MRSTNVSCHASGQKAFRFTNITWL